MVSRPSRSRRSARFFVKEIGWQVRLGYGYTEGLIRRPIDVVVVAGTSPFSSQICVQVPADKTGEAVVASSLFDSALLKLPLRIREVTCSTDVEVTNRFAAV
jgi:hypothetical protein